MNNLINKYSLNEIKQIISGKKILSIDFGLKRIGLATCDTLHITTSPLATLQFNDTLIQNLIKIIGNEKIEVVLIGIPVWKNNDNTQFAEELNDFTKNLVDATQLPIVFFDESYSSKKGLESMVSIGKKKKFRRKKENLDKFAAAIILQSFLDEIEG